MANARSLTFCGLPLAVIGNSSIVTMYCGILNRASFPIAERGEIVLLDGMAGLGYHAGACDFAQSLVKDADDLDLTHCRMVRQKQLNFGGIHIFAADFKQVFDASEKPDRAVFPLSREISGMQPTGLGDRLCRLFGLFVAALH